VGGKIVIAGPAEGISGGTTLEFGSTKIEFIEIEKAHTDNDLLIHVKTAQGNNAVFLGDLSFHKRLGRMLVAWTTGTSKGTLRRWTRLSR